MSSESDPPSEPKRGSPQELAQVFVRQCPAMFVSGFILVGDGDCVRICTGQMIGEDFIFSGHLAMTHGTLEKLAYAIAEWQKALAEARSEKKASLN